MDKLKFFSKSPINKYSRALTSNSVAITETGSTIFRAQDCIIDSSRISRESEQNVRLIDRVLAQSRELREKEQGFAYT